jgi:hypothetical protein
MTLLYQNTEPVQLRSHLVNIWNTLPEEAIIICKTIINCKIIQKFKIIVKKSIQSDIIDIE